jgi:hypothetical protein
MSTGRSGSQQANETGEIFSICERCEAAICRYDMRIVLDCDGQIETVVNRVIEFRG